MMMAQGDQRREERGEGGVGCVVASTCTHELTTSECATDISTTTTDRRRRE